MIGQCVCIRMCVRVCVTVIMGFCVGTFNFLYCILWVRWVSTLWENSSCSHLGLGILGMCVQACPPPPLSLAPLPLRVMIMTSYNVKVVYRNFGFRLFLFFFFISFEIELCVSSFNAEPCDSYANGVLLLGTRREE